MSNHVLLKYRKNLLSKFNTREAALYLNFNRKRSVQPVNLSYTVYEPNQPQDTTKSPLIILHGFLGSKINWRSLGKAISAKYNRKVYTLDARNHGDSPCSVECDYPIMALDVKYLMNSINIKRGILLGHSMGGRTAMYLALSEPKLVEKLVVVDISPCIMPQNEASVIPGYLKAMKNALKNIPSGLTLAKARKLAEEYMSQTVSDKAICQYLLTNLTQANETIRWKVDLDVLEKVFVTGITNFPLMTASFPHETLFICGENSPYVSYDDHSYIRTLFPQAKFTYIHGAGHWVHSDKPSEFLDAVSKWL